jgi:hypothetical protein
MEYRISKSKISMQKILSSLDKFVFSFCSVLEKCKIKYVVVSGYVAIVFGRNRNTEDIDIISDKISFEKFKELWNALKKKYICLNTEDVKSAYFDYLLKNISIRFSKRNEFIPNIEFKFVKDYIDNFTLSNAITLEINKNKIHISQLELQIAYKLKLDSDKDIEDAIFLYELFKSDINRKLLSKWINYFKINRSIVKELSG